MLPTYLPTYLPPYYNDLFVLILSSFSGGFAFYILPWTSGYFAVRSFIRSFLRSAIMSWDEMMMRDGRFEEHGRILISPSSFFSFHCIAVIYISTTEQASNDYQSRLSPTRFSFFWLSPLRCIFYFQGQSESIYFLCFVSGYDETGPMGFKLIIFRWNMARTTPRSFHIMNDTYVVSRLVELSFRS